MHSVSIKAPYRSLPDSWTVGRHEYLETSPEDSANVLTHPICKDDMIIAIMGPTGSGKSTFINIATQSQNAVVGHNLESCTQLVTAYGCRHPDGNRNVVFVDTPGFDDTNRSDGDVLSAIANWLVDTYNEKITLSGILYFHRISDNRMAGTPLRNLGIFRELCGQDALKNVILTTTFWSDVAEVDGRSRETELISKYWRSMIVAGSRVSRFGRTHENAWEIIRDLYPVQQRRPLLIQVEMVDQGKLLSQTSAGSALLRWFNDLIRQIRDLIRRIEGQLRGIPKEDAVNRTAALTERDSLACELEAVTRQQRGLHEGKRQALRRRFSSAYEVLRRRPLPSNSPLNPDASSNAGEEAQDDLQGVELATTLVLLRHARDLAEIPPVPFLKGTCRIAYTVAEASLALQCNTRALRGIASNANQLLHAVNEQTKHGDLPQHLVEIVNQLARELAKVEPIVKKALSRHTMMRYVFEPAEKELLKDVETNIEAAYRQFTTAILININRCLTRLENGFLAVMSTPDLSDSIILAPAHARCSSPEPIIDTNSQTVGACSATS
ncbi:hypothetical protein ONZ45_g5020 [Pleurotus djamor]|nr:hypothetical protein ONZ45_g5020 [Pleurotus djamor]